MPEICFDELWHYFWLGVCMTKNKGIEKYCIITSMGSFTGNFLVLHNKVLNTFGEVDLICCDGRVDLMRALSGNLINIDLPRSPSLIKDIIFLLKLIFLFHKKKYRLVFAATPKVMFLATFAAFVNRVPIRSVVFTGQVWSTKHGLSRFLLKICDRITAKLSTTILIDSPSQKAYLVKNGIINEQQGAVILHGSICGVDLNKFHENRQKRNTLRSKYGFSKNDFIILYLGRLNESKGIKDLALAFERAAEKNKNLKLLVVGNEDGITKREVREILGATQSKAVFCEYTKNPEEFYQISDLLSLPSYREGFGQVIIEAAACGLPAMASDIYGISDALVDNKTGVLHMPGDIIGIENLILDLSENKNKLTTLAVNASTRVKICFSQKKIYPIINGYFLNLLQNASNSSD